MVPSTSLPNCLAAGQAACVAGSEVDRRVLEAWFRAGVSVVSLRWVLRHPVPDRFLSAASDRQTQEADTPVAGVGWGWVGDTGGKSNRGDDNNVGPEDLNSNLKGPHHQFQHPRSQATMSVLVSVLPLTSHVTLMT